MERIRTALFLDFDNLFSGLLELDRKAAYTLAREPGKWLDALATWKLSRSGRRDFLLRRAYMNPAGWIKDTEEGNDSGRVYFSRFRPNLTKSGLEVMDCPTLTSGQKNAADIRIVIDVLQSLDANTRYDEFIIASGDADFTPLLQCLRAADRRTIIISSGVAAQAYRSVANVYIDAEDLVTLLVGGYNLEQEAELPVSATSSGIDVSDKHGTEYRDRVEQRVREYIGNSDGPVLLSRLGIRLRSEFGDIIDRSQWFSTGSLGRFISMMPDLYTRDHYVWNPDIQSEPGGEKDTPERIAQICRIADLPLLSSAKWKATIEMLVHYGNTHDFNLTQATAWTRDQLKKKGIQVGRQAIGVILRASFFGGAALNANPVPNVEDIQKALIRSTTNRVQAAGLDLTEQETSELEGYFQG